MEHLIRFAWDIYDQFKYESVVVKPSIPILYFGDSAEYFLSKKRIITVGLNPSKAEFPPEDPFMRFPAAHELSYELIVQPSEHASVCYLSALSDYYSIAPYRRWFDGAYRHILKGLDASFYGDMENTVLHTDICSPLATNPTWSKLPKSVKDNLIQRGKILWHNLVEYLQPDLMLISVARAYLDVIEFTKIIDWRKVYTVDRENLYCVQIAQYKLASGKNVVFMFGRAAELPFGTLSYSDQHDIGVFMKHHWYSFLQDV